MPEINLLNSLPKAKRPLEERAQASEEDRKAHWRLGKEYFDGTRAQGLGGYYYDGRWRTVAQRMIEYYELKEDARILDIGCAKGFLLHDFLEELPSASIAGIDISDYAILEATDRIKPHLCIGNARQLPYPENDFDLVISVNSLHNILDRSNTAIALSEIERVSRGNSFVSLGAYSNAEEKNRLDRWAVVATTYLHVEDWLSLFVEAGYNGDYTWFKP